MRMYLASYRIGEYGNELVRLAGSHARGAIIMNAGDMKSTEERIESTKREVDDLQAFGFLAEELDLRNYFGKPEELESELKKFDFVWVRGGNTFILKRAFEKSGFGDIIIKRLKEDSIVYSGYSAGVVILAPSMHGLEIVDDPNELPLGYTKEFNWDGLGILPYSVAVHYKSEHPESAGVDQEIQYCIDNDIPYKTLRDGEVIVLEGDKETFLNLKS